MGKFERKEGEPHLEKRHSRGALCPTPSSFQGARFELLKSSLFDGYEAKYQVVTSKVPSATSLGNEDNSGRELEYIRTILFNRRFPAQLNGRMSMFFLPQAHFLIHGTAPMIGFSP